MHNVEEVTSKRFNSVEQAIAKYGSYTLELAIASPLPFRSVPATLEEDMVVPLVEKIKTSTLRLRLQQLTDGRKFWWQYINEGEI